MKNFIQNGETVTLTAPAAVASGGVVVVDSIVGIASGAAALGEDVECVLEGVFTLPKAAGEAIGQGAKVYWDGDAVTATATGNSRLGAALAAAATSATTIRVRLDGAHV